MDIKQLLAMCADDAKNEEDAAIIMSAVQRITELEQRIRELEQQLAASREVCADYVRSFSELEQQLEYWKQECNHRIAQLAQMTAERDAESQLAAVYKAGMDAKLGALIELNNHYGDATALHLCFSRIRNKFELPYTPEAEPCK